MTDWEVSVAQLLAKPGEQKLIRREVEFQPQEQAKNPAGNPVKGTIKSTAKDATDLGIETTAAKLDSSLVRLELTLSALTSGEISVWGSISASWKGPCRRCLQNVGGELNIQVKEVFETRPREGETYLMEEGKINLRQMTREVLLLNLPLAPLCSRDCRGPAPDIFAVDVQSDETQSVFETQGVSEIDSRKPNTSKPASRPADPRWAALSEIDFE